MIDEHVPVSSRTYQGLLGAKYLRFGNFQTSLLECLLDPNSYTIRGVTLLCFDQIHEPYEFGEILELGGLPMLDVSKSGLDVLGNEGNRAEVRCEISVGLASNYFEVDLFGIKNSNKKIACGRTLFFLRNEELTGIRFIDLTLDEKATLQAHIRMAGAA